MLTGAISGWGGVRFGGVQSVVAYVPDLMDRSKVSAAAAGDVRFVRQPGDLAAAATTADLVVVDLGRDGVLDEARAAGCSQVLARSAFFAQVATLLA